MATAQTKPYTEMSLLEFAARFSNEQSCWDYLGKMRWSEGFECPKCKNDTYCFLNRRNVFQCNKCKKQQSAIAGTLFHKSRVPLQKGFWCIYFMATSNKGTPILDVQGQLNINSYRTVLLMTHKIRHAMAFRDSHYTLGGTIETDEIFIGGKQSLREMEEFGSNKTPFLIMVEENSYGGPRFLSFEELETIYVQHVVPALEKHIRKGSMLKSDGAGSYVAAKNKGYENDRVVVQKEPDKAHEHLKWVNVITSNLKRYLLSTHHGVFPKYRKAFLVEFAYRFNRRFWPHQAFDRLLYACINCDTVTLDELTA